MLCVDFRWKLLCEYNEGIDRDSIVGKEKLLLNFQLHNIVNKDFGCCTWYNSE